MADLYLSSMWQVLQCSARTGAGVDGVWANVMEVEEALRSRGKLLRVCRERQQEKLLKSYVEEEVITRIRRSDRVKAELQAMGPSLRSGRVAARAAALEIVNSLMPHE
eukprot:TRINITY_DN12500_c0_g1_i1.p1 TRINITY_DN12500_c0_g1~~TRINITY_DN12500_c0_g1_i1.p1  ORF type:complete len:118 (-),score=49.23 TRINITY_DN12500_c0_g1_i1:427-750(-)